MGRPGPAAAAGRFPRVETGYHLGGAGRLSPASHPGRAGVAEPGLLRPGRVHTMGAAPPVGGTGILPAATGRSRGEPAWTLPAAAIAGAGLPGHGGGVAAPPGRPGPLPVGSVRAPRLG